MCVTESKVIVQLNDVCMCIVFVCFCQFYCRACNKIEIILSPEKGNGDGNEDNSAEETALGLKALELRYLKEPRALTKIGDVC